MNSQGFAFEAIGVGPETTRLGLQDAVSGITGNHSLVWLNLVAEDREATSRFLREQLGFHELEVEDPLSPNERPAFSSDKDNIFLVIPAIVATTPEVEFVEVAIFAGKHYVVSVTQHPVPELQTWMSTCMTRPKSIGSSIKLVHSLVDHIMDGYFPIMDDLVDAIEDLEDRVYAGGKMTMGDAMRLKRQLLDLRRRAVPIRDVLNGIMRRDNPLISEAMIPYFQDVYDHCLRLVEIIDNEREVLSGVLDAHLAVISNDLNLTMRKMTVISTVLMTCGLVAGVYGMNFPNIPEFDVKGGYFICLGVMAALSLVEVYVFRKLKWL